VLEGQVDRRRSSNAGALEAADLLPGVHTMCLQQAGMFLTRDPKLIDL
jgi:hypothetical protein